MWLTSLFLSVANLLHLVGSSGDFVCGVFRWFLKKNGQNLKYCLWSPVSFVWRQTLGAGMTLVLSPQGWPIGHLLAHLVRSQM